MIRSRGWTFLRNRYLDESVAEPLQGGQTDKGIGATRLEDALPCRIISTIILVIYDYWMR